MRIKKIIGKVHLWLGFTSGIIVCIIAVTGCFYAFQAEIRELAQASYRKAAPQNTPYLLPSQIKEIAEKQLPGKHVHSVQYGLKDRAAVVSFFSLAPEYYYCVYVNPYSGEVLKVKNMNRD